MSTRRVSSSSPSEPFTTATTPYSPILSQNTKPVATTPINIWHFSWNQELTKEELEQVNGGGFLPRPKGIN